MNYFVEDKSKYFRLLDKIYMHMIILLILNFLLYELTFFLWISDLYLSANFLAIYWINSMLIKYQHLNSIYYKSMTSTSWNLPHIATHNCLPQNLVPSNEVNFESLLCFLLSPIYAGSLYKQIGPWCLSIASHSFEF